LFLVPTEAHALRPCAQFLCYKQLKKFLKQLPDTSVGARAPRAPMVAALARFACTYMPCVGTDGGRSSRI